MASKTRDEWILLLEAKEILVAPVRSTVAALADPQLVINGMVVEVEHPQLGKMWHVGTPLRLGGQSGSAGGGAYRGGVACGGLCRSRYRRLTGCRASSYELRRSLWLIQCVMAY